MNTTYMNTTDHAAAVRAELKRRHGWTSKQVSVRADYFSMGSALRIRIKSPDVPYDAVEAIANTAEDIRRDERTGEILNGGNRYVTVSYDSEALRIIGDRFVAHVEAAIARLDDMSDSSLSPVGETDFMIGRAYGRLSVWLRNAGHQIEAFTARDAAEFIGARMLRAARR